MVKHAEETTEIPAETTDNSKDAVLALIVAGALSHTAIAKKVGVTRYFVQKVAREMVGGRVNHSLTDSSYVTELEHQVTTKASKILRAIKASVPASDCWAWVRSFNKLITTARLLSDQSTANVAHRSLAGMVSRRAGAIEAPKVPDVLKTPAKTTAVVEAEPVAVQIARAETDSAVPEPLV